MSTAATTRALSIKEQRLLLAALNSYARCLGKDKEAFEGKRNRAFELRETRIRIEDVTRLHALLENAEAVEIA